MDVHDLFKKLAAGTKFDTKRFRHDAERFQMVRFSKSNIFKNEKIEEDKIKATLKSDLKRKCENENKAIDKLFLLDKLSVPKDGIVQSFKKHKKVAIIDKVSKLEKEKVNQLRNQNHISVTGNRVPKLITKFDELETDYQVSTKLLNNMKNCKYVYPTPIQMQAIPIMLEGRQILACAPTGSGKTAAFLLPIIHSLHRPQKKGFRAVILNPTRELAKQTYRECLRLSDGYDFKIHIISKVNQAIAKYGLRSSQKFDILITTPKRLVFLLNQNPPIISLNNVEWLIVDEADKLFEDGIRGFRKQLDEIMRACTNTNLHCGMFSATNIPAVLRWCRRNMKGLITVTVGQRNTCTNIVDQELVFVGNERGKLIAFRNIIKKGILPPVLVFVQSKERAQELFNELIYDGINVDVIHADKTMAQRDNIIRYFREGKIWMLICTELISRGIDFKGVNLVINYDFPPSAISYIHRIGRTGRAGHKGQAVTFFTQQDTVNLRSIAIVMRTSGCNVPNYMLAMKKHSKKERRKFECTEPSRERILTTPMYTPHRRKSHVKDIFKLQKEA